MIKKFIEEKLIKDTPSKGDLIYLVTDDQVPVYGELLDWDEEYIALIPVQAGLNDENIKQFTNLFNGAMMEYTVYRFKDIKSFTKFTKPLNKDGN